MKAKSNKTIRGVEKFSAFVRFASSNSGKMEFSDSLERLKKLILANDVCKVVIFEQRKNRPLMTLTATIHL